MNPLIIGHRGAAAVAPENTLASFKRALRDGADGIEFDVRLARDGVPVVIHDATLRRTAARKGRVVDFSSEELSAMDVGTWFNISRPSLARVEYARATIPTLSTVFETLRGGDALLYVELKCGRKDRAELAAKVVGQIRAYGLKHQAVVESFDLTAISEIKRLDREICTAALFDRKLSRPIPSARRLVGSAINCGAEEIALHHSLATRRNIQEAHERGLKSVVWTVDGPAWVERAIKKGLHAIITNNPARMFERRAQLMKSKAEGKVEFRESEFRRDKTTSRFSVFSHEPSEN